jgi:outer membrane receptor protein involved in Fe transport
MGEEMRKNKQSPVVFAKKPAVVATQVALAVMAQFAYAQQQVAERVERVEITGTRLPALNVEGPSPVTVMDAQEIRMDGLSKTEDLLNALPQVFASQNSNMSNGATGTANVNLRGLGPTRNLVLLNGRRLPAGSPRSGAASAAADLNQIPAPLIQRVELLTGGASAVYGSDAITGVVNFIMNDRFEGLQIDLYHSFYNHQQQNPNGIADVVNARHATNPSQFNVPGDVNDGAVNGISLLMGRNFADNKGNATAYFAYKKEAAVSQANRDFSACALNQGTSFTCGGSSTSFPGRFIMDNGVSRTVADSAGNTRAFAAATDQFNFGPYNYYRRPSEQLSFNTFAHLDLTPKVRAYTELGFHDNKTNAVIAPSGIFLTPQTIFFENPLLSPAWRADIAANSATPFAATGNTATVVIGRRNIEGGGRDDNIRHSSYRAVMGAKGDLNKTWTYDAFFQTATVLYQSTYRNDFSNVRIGRALDVVTDPATGAPTCRSALPDATGVIVDANCRPYNIWRLGGVTQDALDYLQTPGLQNGETRMHVMGATVQADLGNYGLKMPTARDGLAFAFGLERRKESLTLQTDTEFETGDLAGQGGATRSVSGKLDVDEWFTEARLPLAQRMPLADLLSVNGSYRRSNYSTGKTTDTYGVGAEWAPVRNYRARASYQHAIRHANIQELFQPQGNNLFGFADPCGTGTGAGGALIAPTATFAQCARTGLTAAQYNSAAGQILINPAGQYNFLQGGNPNLDPEKANTYTVGLVMTPVRNFTASIDWWDIKIDDAIGNAPPSTVFTQCLTAGQFCSQVQRDARGTLWLFTNGRVVALNQNLGQYHTTGLDIAANYTWRMGNAGGFGIHFLGSWLDTWEFEPIKGTGKFDCAGLYGPQCGAPNPVWRHKARASWATPWNVDLALTWRHIDKIKHEFTSSDPLLAGSIPATDAELAARDYFDLAGQWNINKTFSLRAGVNNLFDKDPPIVSNISADPSIFGNGNTFPQVYDALGRLIFLNLTMKF